MIEIKQNKVIPMNELKLSGESSDIDTTKLNEAEKYLHFLIRMVRRILLFGKRMVLKYYDNIFDWL